MMKKLLFIALALLARVASAQSPIAEPLFNTAVRLDGGPPIQLNANSFSPQNANCLMLGPASGTPDAPSCRNLSSLQDFLANGLRVSICRVTANVDIVNDSVEETIFSCAIPAGALGTQSLIEITMWGDWLHNNLAGDTMSFKVKWPCSDATPACPGGVNIYGNASLNTGANSLAISATRLPWYMTMRLQERQTTASQAGGGIFSMGINIAPSAGLGSLNNQDVNVVAAGTIVQTKYTVPFMTDTATADSTVQNFVTITVKHGTASASNSWRLIGGYMEIVP